MYHQRSLLPFTLSVLTALFYCRNETYASNFPTLFLQEPSDSSVFIAKNSNTVAIPVSFQLFDLIDGYKSNSFCFQLIDSETKELKIDQTCVSIENEKLNILRVNCGHYNLIAFLVDNKKVPIAETKVDRSFTVKKYEDAIPSIRYIVPTSEFSSSGQPRYVYAANALTNAADVTFEYSFEEDGSPLSLDAFLVCIRIVNIDTQQVALKLSCIPSTQRTITLKNMKRGDYNLFLQLKMASADSSPSSSSAADNTLNTVVMEKSERTIFLSIGDVVSLLPTLIMQDTLQEYAANSASTADVTFTYKLQGLPSAVAQVQACLQIFDLSIDTLILKATCVPREHTEFTLSRMKVGRYKAILTLRNDLDFTSYESTQREVEIDIRVPVEFKPSYDWQRLHAWHTIPSGIETRLPVDGVGHKEARIPNPWQLQLSMPQPCKFFLRMDVLRDTTMADISKRASAQCAFPSTCFHIQVLATQQKSGKTENNEEVNAVRLTIPDDSSDGFVTLSHATTVEEGDFFSVEKRIILDPTCSRL